MTSEPARGSLATRIVLACVAVAGIAVLVAGVVMAGLARRSAQNVLQDSLAAQADVIASQVDERGLGSRAVGLGRVAEVVRGQGIARLRASSAGASCSSTGLTKRGPKSKKRRGSIPRQSKPRLTWPRCST